MRPDKVTCPRCDSDKVKMKGKRQRQIGVSIIYICEMCGRSFTPLRKYGYSRYPSEIIDYVLKTCKEKKLSLCELSEDVYRKFKVKMNQKTISYLFKKYGGGFMPATKKSPERMNIRLPVPMLLKVEEIIEKRPDLASNRQQFIEAAVRNMIYLHEFLNAEKLGDVLRKVKKKKVKEKEASG